MDSIKKEVVVISATQYSMVDENTGEVNEGTSVRYVLNGNLDPVHEDQLKGYKLGKAGVTFNNFMDFIEVPGVYEADLNFNIDKDGRVKVAASNFKFKKSLFPAPAGK